MLGFMLQLIFTQPDCWTGGSIDALMFFGDASIPLAGKITGYAWSFPDLDGPYLDRTCEPHQQSCYDLGDFGYDGFQSLCGVMNTSDGHRVPIVQSTIIDEHGLWIYLGSTVGGLPPRWDVGAYPFDDGKPITWLLPLVEQLRALTAYVHQQYPLLAASYGWLTLDDVDILLEVIAGQIPDKRWAGISVWRGNESTYYPSTHLMQLFNNQSQ
jgi:hypothetical protein